MLASLYTFMQHLSSIYFMLIISDRGAPAQRFLHIYIDLPQVIQWFCAGADMLLVVRFPEWPAAAAVLVRFVVAVTGPRGLQHGDNAVRQCCVDLLGTLVAQLYFEAAMAEQEQPWLSQISGAPQGQGQRQAELGRSAFTWGCLWGHTHF